MRRLRRDELEKVGFMAERWLENASPDVVQALVDSLQDYHNGFKKGRLPEEVVTEIGEYFMDTVTPEDVQVELVIVQSDMTWAYHGHNNANAFCMALGYPHRLPGPRYAFALVNGKRARFTNSDTVFIPRGVPHTFTVGPGGYLAFLSVQNEPIDQPDHDDFHEVVLPEGWENVASVEELVRGLEQED